MSKRPTSAVSQTDWARIDARQDEDIDLSDIPETSDWDTALRGMWKAKEYEPLGYDVRAVANEILKRLRGIFRLQG